MSTTRTQYDSPWSQYHLLSVLAFSYLIAYVDRAALPLLAQPIKQDLGLSDLQISLLLGLSLTLLSSFLIIPAGRLVDRVNRIHVLRYSVVAWSCMTVLCGLARNFATLAIGRAGVGISEAGIAPTGISLIRSVFPPERRGRAFAVFGLAPSLAIGTSLLLGGVVLRLVGTGAFAGMPVLGRLHGFQVVLLVCGVLGVLPLILLGFVGEPARSVEHHSSGTTSSRPAFAHLRSHWTEYLPICVFGTANSMIAFSIGAWLPTLIGRNWHLSPAEVGARLGLLYLVAAPIGHLLVGTVMDSLVRRGVRGAPALVGFVTSSLTLILVLSVAQCRDLYVALPLIGALTALYGGFYPVGVTLLASVTPANYMGTISSVYLMLQQLIGQALAPTIVALVAANFEGPRAIGFGLAICSAVFGVVGLLSLLKAYLVLRRGSPLPAQFD